MLFACSGHLSAHKNSSHLNPPFHTVPDHHYDRLFLLTTGANANKTAPASSSSYCPCLAPWQVVFALAPGDRIPTVHQIHVTPPDLRLAPTRLEVSHVLALTIIEEAFVHNLHNL